MAYIKSEVVAQQKNGQYCKYSPILKSVVVTNMTLESHKLYWERLYKDKPKYMREAIVEACEDKILNDCIDLKEMVDLVKKSSDSEKEKGAILKAILHKKRRG